MTLEQLRIFVAVAERQHVTQAAESLEVAQSAVSSAIAALEARHGTRLFDREGRGIRLNQAGSLFLTEARAVLARAAVAEAVLSDLTGLRRGRLAIAASQTVGNYWLPRHIVALKQAHPGIDVALTLGNTHQVARAIHDGTADLGFIEGVVEDATLTSTVVGLDQLVLLVGPDHDWAKKPPEREELSHSLWVLREVGSGTRQTFLHALRELRLPVDNLDIVLELPSNEAVRSAVEAGLGATALSASVAAASLEPGLLHHVPCPLPDRAFTALQHRSRHASRAADAFMRIISQSTPRRAIAPKTATRTKRLARSRRG